MYLIVGLGNPEPEYSNTRHNIGFDVINKLSEKYYIPVNKKGLDSLYGIGQINEKKVILVKPQTYMNLSGEAIIKFVNYFKIDKKDIIVIYDDIDINTSVVKLRKKGSAGTHNGMKSVIENLPENKNELINYVISKLSKDEYNKLECGIELGVNAVIQILENGVDIAMNKINTKI